MTEPIGRSDEFVSRPSVDPNLKLLADLRMHQLELELQNEELRQTQHQLEAARARYFDLYQLAPVGYITLSPKGLMQDVNVAAATLLGITRDAMVTLPLTHFILPADQDTYYMHRKALVETAKQQVFEIRLLTASGSPTWVRFEMTSVVDSLDQLAFRAVIIDIEARKQAEETLRASELRHRVLFEMSHDALMTLAPPDWQFTDGNSKTLAMFGARSLGDFVGRRIAEYSPEHQPDGALSAEKAAIMIETALREGSHFYEWTYRRFSGADFPTCVLLTRIEIQGHPLLQATVRDETEVRKLQGLLAQADRLASMGMLAAGVAHEINNPLASVLYNTETIVEKLPHLADASLRCLAALRTAIGDAPCEEIVGKDVGILEPTILDDLTHRAEEALVGAQRIRTISKAIGTFSRVESTEHSRVNLNYAIECAATMAKNDIRFRAKLVLELKDLPTVWASEGKLSQVFLNLLINAAQAIGEGDVEHSRINVHTWAEGDDVFAAVQDSGKGISEENLLHIFDPFFTTKPVGVGSGLGLAICQNIVTEFGGSIDVESQLGKGTRFLIRLPVQRGISLVPRSTAISAVPERAGARGRILVVDDEAPIRKLMERMLGSDHDLVTAATGTAARAILEHDQTFDVILCDLMMPEMTGMDLHKWMAGAYPALAKKVVFMTGGAFTPNASKYVTHAGNRWLEKPYDAAVLRKLVAKMVAHATEEAPIDA